jgi:hypothetical protein
MNSSIRDKRGGAGCGHKRSGVGCCAPPATVSDAIKARPSIQYQDVSTHRGTEALAFDTRVTEGQPSENRIVLLRRGDQLVGLNFSTVEASTITPAKPEIDKILDSLRWST